MSFPNLTPRLHLIAEKVKLLKKNDSYIVADIGTDHAKLPVFLVKTGVCSFVYAGDVRPGPLESAKKTIELYGCSENQIRPVLSDGLKNIPNNFHTAVIAGMGGELIVKILSETSLPEEAHLVLSPMTAAEDLRRWLYDHSFSISSEEIAVEGKRLYPVITAKPVQKKIPYSLLDIYLSPALLKNRENPAVQLYIKKCAASKAKIVRGKETAGLFDETYAEAAALQKAFLQQLLSE